MQREPDQKNAGYSARILGKLLSNLPSKLPSNIGCFVVILGSLHFGFMALLLFEPTGTISRQGWINWAVLSVIAYFSGFLAWLFPRFVLPFLLIGGLSAITADLGGFFSLITTVISVLMLAGAFLAFLIRHRPSVVYPQRSLSLWIVVLGGWLLGMYAIGIFGLPVTPIVFQPVAPKATSITIVAPSTSAPTNSPTK